MLLIVPWEGEGRWGGAVGVRERVRERRRERDIDPDFGNMVMMRVMNAVGQ